MEAKFKKAYQTPAMLVVELKSEGIVCMSQDDYNWGSLDEND